MNILTANTNIANTNTGIHPNTGGGRARPRRPDTGREGGGGGPGAGDPSGGAEGGQEEERGHKPEKAWASGANSYGLAAGFL